MAIGLIHPAEIVKPLAIRLEYRQIHHSLEADAKSEFRDFALLAMTLADFAMGIYRPPNEPHEDDSGEEQHHARPGRYARGTEIAEWS
jgi:hypothetical protein